MPNFSFVVYEVFKNVADKYDLMNDVMSAGIHRLWKDELVRHLSPQPEMRLIDVAGGTGEFCVCGFHISKNRFYSNVLRNTNFVL